MVEAGARWQTSIVGHGEVDPRTLTAHPLNPKVHTVEQDAVVEAMLRRFGWLKPVIVNEVTGHLLDGHERVELAVRRGEAVVPVDYVRVAADDEGTVLRGLDQSGALAKTHLERWAALHRQQPAGEEPVLAQFFAKLAADYGVVEEGEEAPGWKGTWAAEHETQEAERAAAADEIRARWGVEPGQLWQCGAHRVLCADSLAPETSARLRQGGQVDLVVTSPPYGVAKGYEAGVDPEGHRRLLRALGARCREVVKPGGFVVVNFGDPWAQGTAAAWTGSQRACVYPMGLEYWRLWHDEYGWDLYAARAWVKPFARLRQPLWTYQTSLAHQQEWEQVWTWRLPGGGGDAVYDWDVSVHSVWQSGHEVDAGGGPWAHWGAGFPLFVPRQALRAHSPKGAVVWEPFCGAGTTMLACEELGRICLASDRDPGAVAVTLARYYEASGRRPVLVPGEAK